MSKILLYAPNIHCGGGLTLIRPLLEALTRESYQAILDSRFKNIPTDKKNILYLARNSIFSRLKAELILRDNAQEGDIILCFHSLPPIFFSKAKVIVYLHNKHLLPTSDFPLRDLSFYTRSRIFFERMLLALFYRNIDQLIVQTESMRRLVLESSINFTSVSMFPFINMKDNFELITKGVTNNIYGGFLYVASGDAHKNHNNLLNAWVCLAQKNIFPSLILTIGDEYNELRESISVLMSRYNLKIINLGCVDNTLILDLMKKSKALIFPSFTESFGIPLIEADRLNLSILASELDYVRDVCRPKETFDPRSSLSIARAVERFLKIDSATSENYIAKDFIEYIKFFKQQKQ